jgi:hypothetical protein
MRILALGPKYLQRQLVLVSWWQQWACQAWGDTAQHPTPALTRFFQPSAYVASDTKQGRTESGGWLGEARRLAAWPRGSADILLVS